MAIGRGADGEKIVVERDAWRRPLVAAKTPLDVVQAIAVDHVDELVVAAVAGTYGPGIPYHQQIADRISCDDSSRLAFDRFAFDHVGVGDEQRRGGVVGCEIDEESGECGGEGDWFVAGLFGDEVVLGMAVLPEGGPVDVERDACLLGEVAEYVGQRRIVGV